VSKRVIIFAFEPVREVWNEAGSQLHDSAQIIAIPVLSVVGQCVVHLDGALRVANVGDFVLTRCFFDGHDVGFVVMLHICPGEVPVVRSVVNDIIVRVPLAVLGAATVAEPDVVALID